MRMAVAHDGGRAVVRLAGCLREGQGSVLLK